MNWTHFFYLYFWHIDKLNRSAVKIRGCWFSAAGSCASLSSDWSIPAHNTHTTHTHLWVSVSLNFVFSLGLICSSFSLSHLISIPPSLSVRTGKKQGPPENRNKGNPSIHPSVPLCPSILPVTHSILTLHPSAGGECPVHLSAVQRGTFSRLALPVKGCNSQPPSLWQPITASAVVMTTVKGWRREYSGALNSECVGLSWAQKWVFVTRWDEFFAEMISFKNNVIW